MNAYFATVISLFVSFTLWNNSVEGKPFQHNSNNNDGKRFPRSVATLTGFSNNPIRLPTIDPIRASEQEYFEEARHGRQSSNVEPPSEYNGPTPQAPPPPAGNKPEAIISGNNQYQSSTPQQTNGGYGSSDSINNIAYEDIQKCNGAPNGPEFCPKSLPAISSPDSEPSSPPNSLHSNGYVYIYKPVLETTVNTGYHEVQYDEEKTPEHHSIPLIYHSRPKYHTMHIPDFYRPVSRHEYYPIRHQPRRKAPISKPHQSILPAHDSIKSRKSGKHMRKNKKPSKAHHKEMHTLPSTLGHKKIHHKTTSPQSTSRSSDRASGHVKPKLLHQSSSAFPTYNVRRRPIDSSSPKSPNPNSDSKSFPKKPTSQLPKSTASKLKPFQGPKGPTSSQGTKPH